MGLPTDYVGPIGVLHLRNDCNGDDVGRSQLAESRWLVRDGSRAWA